MNEQYTITNWSHGQINIKRIGGSLKVPDLETQMNELLLKGITLNDLVKLFNDHGVTYDSMSLLVKSSANKNFRRESVACLFTLLMYMEKYMVKKAYTIDLSTTSLHPKMKLIDAECLSCKCRKTMAFSSHWDTKTKIYGIAVEGYDYCI